MKNTHEKKEARLFIFFWSLPFPRQQQESKETYFSIRKAGCPFLEKHMTASVPLNKCPIPKFKHGCVHVTT